MTEAKQPGATAGEYPALPEGMEPCTVSMCGDFLAYTADQMRAYVDADRAMRAAQQPYAWAVPPSSRLFCGGHAEYDAKQEARHCGGTARAVPLYTAPQPSPADPADALDAARYRWLRLAHRKTLFGVAFTESEIDAAIDAEILGAAKEAA